MRALIRSLLVHRPVIAFLLVATRWIGWLLAGHPVWVVTTVLTAALLIAIPLPLTGLVVAPALAEAMAAILGRVGFGPTRESLWLWGQACRFRRRWPSRYADARSGDALSLVALTGRPYSDVDGLRPVLAAPRLSILPRDLQGNAVTWLLRPRGDIEPDALDRRLNRMAEVDRRVRSIRVHRTDVEQRMTVTFTSRKRPEPDLDDDLASFRLVGYSSPADGPYDPGGSIGPVINPPIDTTDPSVDPPVEPVADTNGGI